MAYYGSRRVRQIVLGGVLALFRLLRFALIFAAAAIASIVLRALMTIPAHRRHGRRIRRALGRLLTLGWGVRVRRRGEPPLDAPMVVSNHLSWLDSFVLLGELGMRFVANRHWGRIPVLGTALRATGVLFVERDSLRDAHTTGGAIARLLRRGESVSFYPEGHTTRGTSVLSFRGALLEPAAALGLPVGWLALRYETPPGWPPASWVVSWGDWTPFLLHMYRACYVPWTRAQVVFGDGTVTAGDRKTLAAELERRVARLLVPQAQPPTPLFNRPAPPAAPGGRRAR